MIYFIMPVHSDPRFAEKRHALDRLLAQLGERGHFPLDVVQGQQLQIQQILKEMAKARVIVADLSLERPSCYFEVGLAQGSKLPVILIASAGTPIHQVADPLRVQTYTDMDSYVALLSQNLSEDTGFDTKVEYSTQY